MLASTWRTKPNVDLLDYPLSLTFNTVYLFVKNPTLGVKNNYMEMFCTLGSKATLIRCFGLQICI